MVVVVAPSVRGRCPARVPLPRELSLCSPALNPRLGHSQTRLTEALQTPEALRSQPTLRCRQQAWHMGPLQENSPSCWLPGLGGLSRRRHRRPGQGGGCSLRKALGAAEDVLVTARKTWVRPRALMAEPCARPDSSLWPLSFSYKLKGFSTLRPCASLNEASLLCLEAGGSPGIGVPKWEDRWQAGPGDRHVLPFP